MLTSLRSQNASRSLRFVARLQSLQSRFPVFSRLSHTDRYPPLQTTTNPSADKLRIPEFISKYAHTDFSQYENKRFPTTVQVYGRVSSIRRAGKAMYFIDITQDNRKLQLCASNRLLGMDKEEFAELHASVRRGDLVSAVGNPSMTNVGELTIKTTSSIQVVSPCLRTDSLNKLHERSNINRNRVMNYLVSPESRHSIVVKSLVSQAIRDFLTRRHFVEVQTPILAGAGTGANAEPFVTRSKFVEEPLSLRVAPELWLKKLVIGGFDKVFEIGPNFRNEGIDASHNPEFTTCEFYQSFTTLPELMVMTEQILSHMHGFLAEKAEELGLQGQIDRYKSLTARFPRYEFVPTLESRMGRQLPAELSAEALTQLHSDLGLSLPSLRSPASLLDNLSSIYLESLCDNHPDTPVFLYNQPAVMSPLAKSAEVSYGDRKYDISLRFELFINGREYVNSYEEENSPFCQADKFALQQHSKAAYNDVDSVVPDWEYVKSMEYGLPPTGGWGCGIDRLSMLFSGVGRIEDVLTFGTVRDVVRQ